MAMVKEPWSARQQRQLAFVSEFTTDIQHAAGKDNVVADCLSRSIVDAVNLGGDYGQMAADQASDPEVQALRAATTGLQLQEHKDTQLRSGAEDDATRLDPDVAQL
ncbi:hypothetical protein AAFF_G00353450 [Aldrovandia affinis]|uniref:Uncharacterized protein n=1 Tax=Aldrovandia affinis TaxID=143900 RepID=A0AAD7R5L1_9TELE|nr:hypothetical protein AAFF_G00353450 [Aldrovandia affinis]